MYIVLGLQSHNDLGFLYNDAIHRALIPFKLFRNLANFMNHPLVLRIGGHVFKAETSFQQVLLLPLPYIRQR
jgi:hypothetical protein